MDKSAFKKPIIPSLTSKKSFTTLTTAQTMEKAMMGLKVFSERDQSVHTLYKCSSITDRFESNIIYQKHPKTDVYIPIHNYLEKIEAEKVREFAGILTALGAKEIKMTHYTSTQDRTDLHASISVPHAAELRLAGAVSGLETSEKGHHWVYGQPQNRKPEFVDNGQYTFYHKETDWIETKEARLYDSTLLSKTVSLSFNSEDYVSVNAVMKISQLASE